MVTGADGFIGSHLVERLHADGAVVRALCVYNSQGSWGWLDTAPDGVRAKLDVRLGDIRDQRFVEDCCQDIEIVFHLAALIAIPYSYRAPQSFVDTNVTGTLNVLEAVRKSKCARMINTSTSEVYGTPDTLPIVESHPLKGQSPYSATKIAADKLCEAYYSSFGVPVVTLRPFNTYGPRQSMRAIIPTLLCQMLEGATEIKVGNLSPRRDLTFVSDTVDGFVKAAEANGAEGRTIQLGTGRAESIQKIFELCGSISGSKAVAVSEAERIRPDKSEVQVLLSDPSYAKKSLNWRPNVALEQGIAQTCEWLRANSRYYQRTGYQV
jgi:NAD dependent epimerase/dehydratase